MPETTGAYDFRGRTVVDREGEKIGKIDGLYFDATGGQPEWALVNTSLFGTNKTFVPIRSASRAGEDLKVPVTKAQVKDAPRVDADQALSENEERQLFELMGSRTRRRAQRRRQALPALDRPATGVTPAVRRLMTR